MRSHRMEHTLIEKANTIILQKQTGGYQCHPEREAYYKSMVFSSCPVSRLPELS